MAKKNASSGLLRNGKLIWLGIAFLLILVFVGSLSLLRGVFQTETYYVLKQDVPNRTLITMDMLEPVVTSVGTSPGGAPEMTQEERDAERAAILTAVQSDSVYAQFPLVAGDILSPSNVGGLNDISVGVPDSWVITSFSVNADNAVGGRIQRGYYFDMLVVGDNGAYYPFVNMLVLDTSVSLDSASSADAVESEEANDGQTSQYTVGLNPENAAKLHKIVADNGGNIKMVLSPRQNEYAAPQLASYTGLFNYDQGADGVIAPGLIDNGDGTPREATDYTFTDVERDEFGRPITAVDNVGLGNSKVTAEQAGDASTNATPAPTETSLDQAPTDEAPIDNNTTE